MKTCTRCHQAKPLDGFHVRKASPDGLLTRCKTCIGEIRRQEHDAKLGRLGKTRKYGRPVIDGQKQCTFCWQWRPTSEFHKPSTNECKPCVGVRMAKYNAENRDHRIEAGRRRYREMTPDQKRADQERLSVYRQTPEGKAAHQKWYDANREANVAKTAAWVKANPERARKNAVAALKRRRARLGGKTRPGIARAQLRAKEAYWGNRCWMCGGAAQQLDHVKPIAAGGPHLLANLRPACQPCNNRKAAKWPVDVRPFNAKKVAA